MDTITLKNPYDDVTANFQIKTITTVSYKYLWQTIYEPQEVEVKDISLSTGMSKTYTVDEGTETYIGTGRHINQWVEGSDLTALLLKEGDD